MRPARYIYMYAHFPLRSPSRTFGVISRLVHVPSLLRDDSLSPRPPLFLFLSLFLSRSFHLISSFTFVRLVLPDFLLPCVPSVRLSLPSPDRFSRFLSPRERERQTAGLFIARVPGYWNRWMILRSPGLMSRRRQRREGTRKMDDAGRSDRGPCACAFGDLLNFSTLAPCVIIDLY